MTANVQDHPCDPPQAEWRRARSGRGSRRGVPAAGVVRTGQPRTGGRRRTGVCESQKRGRRHDAESGPPALVARRDCRPSSTSSLMTGGPAARARATRCTRLRGWGLPVEPHWETMRGPGCARRLYARWADARHSLPFDTDGVVVKVDEFALRDRLGVTAKFPRWATAFKFPAQQATTTAAAYRGGVGRTGAVTPYAVLRAGLACGIDGPDWRRSTTSRRLRGATSGRATR